MSSVNVEITGDARKLEQTFNKIEAGQDRVEKGFADTAAASKDSARQIEAANEAAATKGQGSYSRIITELRKQGPEGRAAAKAIEQHLQTAGKAGRRSMNEVLNELGELDDVSAQVAAAAIRDLGNVGEKGKEAFGESAVSSLKKFAGQWVAVSKAVDLVKGSIDAMTQAQQAAVESLEANQPANQRLLQVTNTTEEYRAAQLNADRIAGTYGIGREEARGLGFSAISAGFVNDQDYIAQNAPILGIESQASVAGIATKTFSAEGVRVDQAIEATLVAAAESVFNFEQLAAGLPKLATRAKDAGSGFDEMLGVLSAASDHFQSVDRSADRLGAFASKVALDSDADGRRSLKGLGLMEASRVLEEDYTDEQRADFLGNSSELNEAFAALKAIRPVAQQRVEGVSQARALAGTSEGIVGRKRAAYEGDAAAVASREKIAAENREEIARERKLALDESKRQTTRSQQKADSYDAGESAMLAEGRGLVRSSVDTVTDTVDSVIADTTGFDKYSAIATQAFAGSESDEMPAEVKRKLEAIGTAAVMLGNQRKKTGPYEDVMLSATDTQTILSTATGQFIAPSEITDKDRRDLTNQINAIASERPATTGMLSTMMSGLVLGSVSSIGGSGRDPASLAAGVPALNREALDLAKQQLAASVEQNTLMREQNALMREQKVSIDTTATNTKPVKPNPSDVGRAAAAQADSRAPR